MTLICAWCKKLIDHRDPRWDGVSHGICRDCSAEWLRKWKEQKDREKAEDHVSHDDTR